MGQSHLYWKSCVRATDARLVSKAFQDRGLCPKTRKQEFRKQDLCVCAYSAKRWEEFKKCKQIALF